MPKHSSTVDSFNVINIGSETDVVQLNPHIGIGTNNPSVSVEINTTDSIKIPKGNTNERPPDSTDFDKGFVRYNTELEQFEGFGAGNRWRSLEGVIDTDQDTYIIAESNVEDNDELQFYTTGDQRMIIKDDGKIGIGTDSPTHKLEVEGDIKLTGNLYKNNVLFSTDDLIEGSSNLYYTEERVDSNIATKNTDNLTEGTANLYYTEERVDSNIATKNTDNLTEGTANLYYTEQRVNTNILNKNIYSYNSNIGVGIEPTEKLDIDGNVLIRSNLKVKGDIFIDGVFSNIQTHIAVTDQLRIVNEGTGPAVIVHQTGIQDIAHFMDDDQFALVIKNAGNVGIGTDTPSHKLQVEGDIKLTGNLYKNNELFTTDDLTEGSSNLYYSDDNVKKLLNNGITGGIISENDIICKGNFKKLLTEEPEVITNNLIAWYKFYGDDVADSSGNGNDLESVSLDGTLQTDFIYPSLKIPENNKYLFPLSITETLMTQNWSISFYVKIDSTNASSTSTMLFGIRTATTEPYDDIYMIAYANSSGYPKVGFNIWNDRTQETTSEFNYYTQDGSVFVYDTWYYITLTMNKTDTDTTVNFYNNGTLIDSQTKTTNFTLPYLDATMQMALHDMARDNIVANNDDKIIYYADFRIYDKALSATEISNLYNHHSLVIPYSLYTDYTQILENKAEDTTNVRGWRIIKNLPASTTSWYSGDDNFSGNYTLNDTTKLLTEEWAISYTDVDWDEILFIKGDFDQWIRLNKSALFVVSTWSTQTSIESHLGVGTTYKYFNDGRPYTPYIASSDSYDHNKILYKEEASIIHTDHFATESYTYNVFIRKSTDTQPVYKPEYKNITFTHDGSTDNQTEYTVNFPEDTTCDILLIAGGGSGGSDRAGGAGAGSCIVYKDYVMNGNYKIKVGKSGNTNQINENGNNGYDSEITNQDGSTVFFRSKGGGGGGKLYTYGLDGGCGGGGGSQGTGTSGMGGNFSTDNIVAGNQNISPSSTNNYVVYGNIGGRNTFGFTGDHSQLDGGGGGGIGESGTSSGNINAVDAQNIDGGKGGDGLYKATINGIDYNFKDHFSLNGKLESDGYYYIGGGGGGGDTNFGSAGDGGKGGGGAGGEHDNHGNNATSYGAGGGGAGGRTSITQRIGGDGFAGVIVIRYKTTIKFESYSDNKVEQVLENKGGTNITWNLTTKEFDCDLVNTDDLTEGTSNLYYTDDRVNTNISNKNIFSHNSNIGIGIQPTEKLDIDGNVLIRSNLRVQGDILITGDFSNIETHVQVTDQFKVENSGTGPALVVNQTGSNDIIDIQDEGISVLFIKDGGNVGIGTNNPNFKLDVSGDINIPLGSNFKINGTAIEITDTTVLVSDTAPKLGGNLDVNGKDIVSTSDGNINIDTNGNGDFVIKGNATKGAGSIKLNCGTNNHGITLKGPPHSATADYILTFPNNVGTPNQVLSTDGNGILSFITLDSAPAAGNIDSDVITGAIIAETDIICKGNFKTLIEEPTSLFIDPNEQLFPPTPPTGLPSVDADDAQTSYNFDLMEATNMIQPDRTRYETENTIVGFSQIINNGLYEFRANNAGATNGKFYRLFTNDTSNWYMIFGYYTDSNGLYNTIGYNDHDLTMFSDGSSQRGVWVEVGMPNKIILTKYSFRMNDTNEHYRNIRSMEQWIICGSNDRITWTIIHNVPSDIVAPDEVFNVPADLVDLVYKTFDTPEPYKYIRKIFIKMDDPTWFAHSSLKLYGINEILVPAIPIDDNTNLIAWYKFDGDLTNSATVGSIGSLLETNTSAQFTTTSGNFKFGQSALFNNTTLTIPNFHFDDLINNSTKSFTVSFWFKANSMSGTWNVLFDCSNYNSYVGGIRVYIKSTDNELVITGYNNGPSSHYISSLNGGFLDNNWRLYSFTFTYNSHSADVYSYNVRFYENSILNGGVDTQNIKSVNTEGFQIGDGNPDGTYPMEGYYDDFRIYDKALSATEVSNLYNNNVMSVNITHKTLTFEYKPTNLIFTFREDESPYSWQEAYNEAIANGKRMPTKTELLNYLEVNGTLYPGQDIWCAVVAPEYSNSKDWIQIGNSSHNTGTSHTGDLGTYPVWGDNTTSSIARFYCEVIEEAQTEYSVNFPEETVCDILIVGGGGSGADADGGGGGGGGVIVAQSIILNGTYSIKVGKGGDSVGTDNGNNGKNSEFQGIIALGGGGGRGWIAEVGHDGGSGGGGGANDGSSPNTNGTSIQSKDKTTYGFLYTLTENGARLNIYGEDGGDGGINSASLDLYDALGGGGGGANQVGYSGLSTNGTNAGKGGDGIYLGDIFGDTVGENGYFAGGGGAASDGDMVAGLPGLGGGGQGYGQVNTPNINGKQNTGGGGGGAYRATLSGSGGSGIVIIRYSTHRIIESYSDNKVEKVLENKGGTNITWNLTTKVFDCDLVNTDNLTEGTSNLYYTEDRVDSNIATKNTDDLTEGSTNKYYTETLFDASLSSKTTDDLTLGSTNKYYTETLFDASLSSKNTDTLTEGTVNLYYTDDRVNTNISNKNIFSDNTNIGIGTQPTAKLDINGNVLIRSNLRVKGDILIDGNFSNIETHVKVTDQFKVENSGTGPALIVNQTGDNDIIDIQDDGTSVLFIKDHGNVGIGTTNPSHKLDIYNGNLVIRTDNENGDASIYFGTPHSSAQTLYKCAIIAEGQGDHSKSKLNFCLSEGGNTATDAVTLSHSRMCINHNGNVGIGLGSTNPTQKLHIQSSNPQILIGDSSSGSGQIYFGNSGHGVGRKTNLTNFEDGNDVVLYTAGSGGAGLKTSGGYLKVSSAGNVGIGTTNPIIPLQVGPGTNTSGTSSRSSVAILSGESSGASELCALSLINSKISGEINNACSIGFNLCKEWSASAKINAICTAESGSADLIFNTYDSTLTEKMRIGANGDVGIGTSNPSYKFDVDGDINCTGNFKINGSDILYTDTDVRTVLASSAGTNLIWNNTNNQFNVIYPPGYSDADVRTVLASSAGTNLIWNNTNNQFNVIYPPGYSDADVTSLLNSGITGGLKVTSGNVGIGTTSPSYALDVYGDINISGTGNFKINGSVITQYGDADVTQLLNNGITNGLKINSGNVGIGTSNPQSLLDVNGEIKCSSFKLIEVPITATVAKKLIFITGGIYNTTMEANGDLRVSGDITAFYSDERLKHKTDNITNVLSILDNINVFKYENNDLANNLGFKNKKSQIGLSAQEINKYYPELVELAPFDSEYNIETNKNISKSGENYLTLKYDRLVPILLQGIKELHSKNIKLENDIELIKSKVGL